MVIRLTCDCAVADDAVMPIRAEIVRDCRGEVLAVYIICIRHVTVYFRS